jgi:flagellar hook-associated protein 3 FlgL
MRVSNAMMAENMKSHLFRQTRQLLRTQERIATGKRINRLSDDPIGMGQAMRYRTSIDKLHQFNSNINNAKFHINVVEDVLNSISELLVEAKKIAADPHRDMRPILAEQVNTLRGQVLQMANSRHNGSYLFAGDLTAAPPFTTDMATGTYAYMGDNGTRDFNIGEGLNIRIEADGSAIFGTIFETLSNLEADLLGDDTAGILSRMSELDDSIKGLNATRAINAGKYKLLQATQGFNDRFRVNTEDLLSRTEEADIAAAAIDLNIQQIAYESILATTSRIMQTSLINFLK